MAANNVNPVWSYDAVLTGVAESVANSADMFCALKLAPQTPAMDDKAGTFLTYGRENMRRDGGARSVGSEAKSTASNASHAHYSCQWYSKKHPVYWDSVTSVQPLEELKMRAAQVVREQMLLDREYEVAALATTTGTYAASHTAPATGKWDNGTGSTFAADIAKAKAAIFNSTGKYANAIFIPPNVQMRMKGVNPFNQVPIYADPKWFSQFGLPSVLEGLTVYSTGALYDANPLGASDTAITNMWGENVVVAYVDPNWVNHGTTFMSTFVWNMAAQGGGFSQDVSLWQYDQPELRCTWVEGLEWRDVVVVNADCGYLITDVLT